MEIETRDAWRRLSLADGVYLYSGVSARRVCSRGRRYADAYVLTLHFVAGARATDGSGAGGRVRKDGRGKVGDQQLLAAVERTAGVNIAVSRCGACTSPARSQRGPQTRPALHLGFDGRDQPSNLKARTGLQIVAGGRGCPMGRRDLYGFTYRDAQWHPRSGTGARVTYCIAYSWCSVDGVLAPWSAPR